MALKGPPWDMNNNYEFNAFDHGAFGDGDEPQEVEAPAPVRPHIMAKCRVRNGGYIEVKVFDVSTTGCLIEKRGWTAKEDDRVLVKLPNLSFQPAYVVWAEDDEAGIAFEQPLYEPIVDHLKLALDGPADRAA